MTSDEWRPVPGYEGNYEVSSRGEFRNLKTGHKTFGHRQKANGYMYVNLCSDGVAKNYRAHILVLQAFSGYRPAGLLARHLDGSRTNNAVSNLAWGTHLDNHYDSVAHGTYEGNYVGKFFDDHPNGKVGKDAAGLLVQMADDFAQTQLAAVFGISQSAVSRLLLRMTGKSRRRQSAEANARKERHMGRQAT